VSDPATSGLNRRINPTSAEQPHSSLVPDSKSTTIAMVQLTAVNLLYLAALFASMALARPTPDGRADKEPGRLQGEMVHCAKFARRYRGGLGAHFSGRSFHSLGLGPDDKGVP
jgi:hypothetical protein